MHRNCWDSEYSCALGCIFILRICCKERNSLLKFARCKIHCFLVGKPLQRRFVIFFFVSLFPVLCVSKSGTFFVFQWTFSIHSNDSQIFFICVRCAAGLRAFFLFNYIFSCNQHVYSDSGIVLFVVFFCSIPMVPLAFQHRTINKQKQVRYCLHNNWMLCNCWYGSIIQIFLPHHSVATQMWKDRTMAMHALIIVCKSVRFEFMMLMAPDNGCTKFQLANFCPSMWQTFITAMMIQQFSIYATVSMSKMYDLITTNAHYTN